MRLLFLISVLVIFLPKGMMAQEIVRDSVLSVKLGSAVPDSVVFKELPMSSRFNFDRHIDTASIHRTSPGFPLPDVGYQRNPARPVFHADGGHQEMLNLMDRNYARYGIYTDFGRLHVGLYGEANKYQMERYVHNQLGIGGMLTYSFSERLSATVFGQYYFSNPYYSMATMPYIGTSQFGGYVTVSGEKMGISLGVRRYYDPFRGGWVTAPIVTPKVRFSSKFELEIPVGDLVRDLIDSWVGSRDRRQRGPMLMPAPQKLYLPVGPPPPVR